MPKDPEKLMTKVEIKDQADLLSPKESVSLLSLLDGTTLETESISEKTFLQLITENWKVFFEKGVEEVFFRDGERYCRYTLFLKQCFYNSNILDKKELAKIFLKPEAHYVVSTRRYV